MSAQPLDPIQQVFEGLAARDSGQILDAYTDDVAGIDEVAKRWMYGRDDLADYTEQLLAAISNCHSELAEANESVMGDVAVVTGLLRQEYDLNGEAESVEMPATFVVRNDSGRWRICLFHALPIPD